MRQSNRAPCSKGARPCPGPARQPPGRRRLPLGKGRVRRSPSPSRITRRRRSVAANQTDELALNLDPVGTENAGLVGLVGGLQRNGGAAAAEALQGCFLIVDESHDDVARVGVV